MKKNKDTLIGFTLSVALHGVLLGAVLFSASQEKKETASAPKSVSISLSSLSEVIQETPKKKVCDKPKKKHKKHKEHKKVAHKPKPAPKKVIKEVAIPVEKIEKVEELVEAEPLEELEKIDEREQELLAAQELQKKEQEAQELAQSLHEEFVKTNFEMIREKVLANLRYPSIAKRMGFEGVVHIMLVIDTSGKLLDVMLEKSSGHKLLDSSALKAANQLSKEILPNPKNISRVTLPVYFALK
ncbi:MAG: energy transducer TonB [Helicobacteraceae bacterium]|nr:energy transducer TonB [Helicobacteraceae bacterium]